MALAAKAMSTVPGGTNSRPHSRQGSKLGTDGAKDSGRATPPLGPRPEHLRQPPKLPEDAPRSRSNSKMAIHIPTAADAEAVSMASPTSPVSRGVSKSASSQPPVAIVHRVALRDWQEMPARPPSADPNDVQLPSMPGLPGSRVRSNSMSKIRLTEETSRRAPTPEGSHLGQLDGTSVDVRALSSQEVVHRRRVSVDWFRGARAINRSVRSIEETETLLEEARKRRASKGKTVERKVEENVEPEWVDPEEEAERAEKAAIEKAKEDKKKAAEQEAADRAAGKARVIDPSAMWGPKPVPKKEPVVAAEDAKIRKRRNRAGSITEGVKVGDGSFLRRMSTRRMTIE